LEVIMPPGQSSPPSIQQVLNSPLHALSAKQPAFSYNDLMAEISRQTEVKGITRFRRAACQVIAKKRKIDQSRKAVLDMLIQTALVNRPKGSKPLDTGKRLDPLDPKNKGKLTSKAIPHGHNYLMEKMDPRHHFANDLAWLFVEYETPPAKTMSFFDWVASLDRPTLKALYARQGWNLSDAEVDMFMNGVEYLDDAQRVDYRLYFRSGQIYTFNGHLFDTTTLVSHETAGRAMYVLSPEKAFYGAPGVVSQRHHSSFLAGAPVMAAGELATDAGGKLQWISASSGHYKPTIQHLRNAVTALSDNGISPVSFKVRAKELRFDAKNKVIPPTPGTRIQTLIPATEFMYSGKTYEIAD
jgi:hypothetical protein